ncbi:hypothetical protein DIPPA_17236 [Diplonema papillatum]|nr:hypothetical protein DIPPA_17236 [Diplonema papillatum]
MTRLYCRRRGVAAETGWAGCTMPAGSMRPRDPSTTTCGASQLATKSSAVKSTVALSSPEVSFFGSKNSHTDRTAPAENTARPSGVASVTLHT